MSVNSLIYNFSVKAQPSKIAPFLHPSLEIFLPAFVGDGSFFILPGFQSLEGDPIPLCECLSVQTGLASPGLDAASLSIFTESVELVLKIRCRDSEKSGQPFPHPFPEAPGGAFLDGLVHMVAHADLRRHLLLHQSPAVAQPAEPVRNGLDLLISMILPAEARGLQNLPGSAQGKAMDI